MTTTNGQIYLIALDTLERLEIQFVPETISPGRNVSYAALAVMGRNIPLYQYTGGEESLPLKLDFHADSANRGDVRKKCQWLKSLTYLDTKRPPQRVKLVFGDLFRNEVWLIKSVKIDYSLFDKNYGFLPRQAYVDITLTLDLPQNPTGETLK